MTEKKSFFSLKYSRLYFLFLSIISITIFSCAAQNREILKKRADANKELGLAYMMQGNYIPALEIFLKAERLNPKDPYIQNNLGLLYMIKKRPNKALYHFQKAYSIKSDFMPALNNLGTAYIALKKWDEAIDCFKKVLSDILYATPHYPLTNLGRAYYEKKDYKTAEEYYIKALEFSPNFQTALYGLAELYEKEKNNNKAQNFYKKIIKLNPKSKLAEKAEEKLYELNAE